MAWIIHNTSKYKCYDNIYNANTKVIQISILYRAIDNTTRRDVAIKIVENIEQNLEEVIQEYQILSDHSLHPNIPQLFGAFRYSQQINFGAGFCHLLVLAQVLVRGQ